MSAYMTKTHMFLGKNESKQVQAMHPKDSNNRINKTVKRKINNINSDVHIQTPLQVLYD